ncbi:hypothetical protein [Nocardia bovistercoris]|uniref:Gasdermin bGSDM n=1 Tax=Nocardia bovistercoris TaxID=2785916 RepID=A0A931I865_9NOCA|nr:hypothetical protein [Nocardia bovistercoris]MBH0775532.1 hypothetical protein [Nocardia bovistercoris]
MPDALVATLNRAGYQPIFLAQTGLTPPELYNLASKNRKPRLVRRGPLTHYLPHRQFTPIRSALPDISNQRSTGKTISGSAEFLSRCLTCIGFASPPTLDMRFANNGRIAFSLGGVFSLRIDPADIDHALTDLDLGAIPEDYVTRGFLHIAYEYAFATSLIMQTDGQREFDMHAASDLPELATLNGRFSMNRLSHNRISFEANSDTDLPAFAYRAGRLTRDTRWRFYPQETYRSELEMPPQPYVLRRGVVLDAETSA